MQSNHRLGYANSKTGYYSYYQSLHPHVHKGINNAFWSTSKFSLQMKHNIFLEIWKVSRSGAMLESSSARSFLMNFFNDLPANIKEGIANRAYVADGCFSWKAVFTAGLVFRKGICTLISGNTSMRFYLNTHSIQCATKITNTSRRLKMNVERAHGPF